MPNHRDDLPDPKDAIAGSDSDDYESFEEQIHRLVEENREILDALDN